MVNLIVRDTAICNNKVSYYKNHNDRYVYRVRLFIDGYYLPYVTHVEYVLHSSILNNRRVIKRSLYNQDCSLTMWLWGKFNVKVNIFLITGEVINTEHYLTFDKQFKKDGLTFIDEHYQQNDYICG